MAFQSVPDCAEAVILGNVNSIAVANVLTFAYTGGSYGQDEIDDLAAAVDAWFATEMLPQLSSSASYLGTRVRGLENSVDFEAFDATGAGIGGAAVIPYPNNVTFAISFKTGMTGRTARGRSYVWGINRDASGANENELSSAAAGAFRDAYEAIPAAILASGWTHVVVSRRLNNVVRPVGTYRQITDYDYTDVRLDTQRRRLS